MSGDVLVSTVSTLESERSTDTFLVILRSITGDESFLDSLSDVEEVPGCGEQSVVGSWTQNLSVREQEALASAMTEGLSGRPKVIPK